MRFELLLSPAMLWIEFAVILMLFSLFFARKMIFFMGLGAATTGFLALGHLLDQEEFVRQFLVFVLASLIWAGILWRLFVKLKRNLLSHDL